MTLPYEYVKSGKNALDEIEKILRAFGVSSFGTMQDFETSDLLVQFTYRGRSVSLRASSKGYAAAWLKQNPYKSGMKKSRQQHHEHAEMLGEKAVYSILRDWIKGQLTAVEIGLLTFEGAFLGQLVMPNGKTVMHNIEHNGLIQLEDHSGENDGG